MVALQGNKPIHLLAYIYCILAACLAEAALEQTVGLWVQLAISIFMSLSRVPWDSQSSSNFQFLRVLQGPLVRRTLYLGVQRVILGLLKNEAPFGSQRLEAHTPGQWSKPEWVFSLVVIQKIKLRFYHLQNPMNTITQTLNLNQDMN